MVILSTGPALMTIIFHLEKFASHGKNKTLHIVSSLYLLIVALIAGPWAALKLKTVKISKAFDVRFRENRIKFMKQETILKAKRQNKGMEFSEIEGR
jgi:Zinc finger, C3HC4 type (RING finger)